MSKTKSKSHNEIEHLNGIIRKLKSENRNLRKRIRELERWESKYEDELLDLEEPDIVIKKVEKCPDCKHGQLEFQDYKFVKYMVCSNKNCDYKEKIK